MDQTVAALLLVQWHLTRLGVIDAKGLQVACTAAFQPLQRFGLTALTQ